MNDNSEHPAVTRFREYLRIKTVQPNPDYVSCTEFLLRQAKEVGLPAKVLEYVPGKPIVLLSWEGREPKLPSILLNSHTDVVPVFEINEKAEYGIHLFDDQFQKSDGFNENWIGDPFEAKKLENGDILARGAQDMKCVGTSYLEAIRNLKSKGKEPLRTIHLSFVPDEEIGGKDGMGEFVKSEQFKILNIGFALDEGIANPNNALKVFYGERAVWWINVIARGNTGHGSQFIQNTATSKLHRIIDRFMKLRDSQERQLEISLHPDGRKYSLGDVTTVNLTKLKAGVQHNVIPQEAKAGFDIRVSPYYDFKKFKNIVEGFVYAESDTEIEYIQYGSNAAITPIDETNPWWIAFRGFVDKKKLIIEPEIFPAATDSRYLREIGIPALGVSYLKNTPVLLHDHNERLNEKVYLEGLEFYTELIDILANVKNT